MRFLLSLLILLVLLHAPSWARYCYNPYCGMCNRLFGPLAQTPVSLRTPTKVDSTPREVVNLMLAVARLKKHDLLYDVGCGDGRVLELAVKQYPCRAVGIEVDSGVAVSARARLSAIAGLPKRWRITIGDATRYDLSQATVACLYLFPETLKVVVPKLTGCTRVLSYSHPVPGYKNRELTTSQGSIYLVDSQALAAGSLSAAPPPKRSIVMPVSVCVGRT
jgi:SAM-dependent methyltransferase